MLSACAIYLHFSLCVRRVDRPTAVCKMGLLDTTVLHIDRRLQSLFYVDILLYILWRCCINSNKRKHACNIH